MCIAAACGENVILNNIVPKHVETLTAKFSELGVNVDVRDERIRINNNAPYQFVDIKTLVYQVLLLICNSLLHHYYLWQMVLHL